jgi:hypothetical protein
MRPMLPKWGASQAAELDKYHQLNKNYKKKRS